MNQSKASDLVGVIELPDQVDFNYHIRPLLSDRCLNCHGPDEGSRKANLRLDKKEFAFGKSTNGGKIIKPGSPSSSEIMKRLVSTDPDYQMPPPEFHITISDYEIALIEKWIDQGAQWKEHWAFIPPTTHPVPQNESETWSQMNDIDHFVMANIQKQNLVPQKEAEAERLLRRLYLDLTGLPPTVDQIDAYLSDASPEAYERKVEELLSSKQYAERMAMEWLDVARYADSHGMHADGWRNMWPWRDWVINSFDENMPYDQFISKQIAGDMMPNPTQDDIIATAFNRNHPMTAEGGAIDEEWRLNYVFDRSETVGTAVLGLTIGCAKCHDHKYDPVSQKEYYQLASFYNNIRELGMTGDDGNYGPVILLTDDATEEKIIQLNKEIEMKKLDITSADFSIQDVKKYVASGKLNDGLIAAVSFDKSTKKKDDNKRAYLAFDGNDNYKTYGIGSLTEGYKGKGLLFSKGETQLRLNDIGLFETNDPFSASVWISTSQRNPKKTQTVMGNTGEKNNFWRGWDIYLDESNRLNARLIHSWPHNAIHVKSMDSIAVNNWTQVGLTYDGSSTAEGLRIYINGVATPSTIEYNMLNKSIRTIQTATHIPEDRPVVLGRSGRLYTGESGHFNGIMDEVKIYNQELSSYEMAVLADKDISLDDKSAQLIAIRKRHPKEIEAIHQLQKKKLDLIKPIGEIMVMSEDSETKDMFVYQRGEYDKPTEKVEANTPKAILAFPESLEPNRLGLTQWLFDEQNPLTARVAVNRYWLMIFGRGLVNTPNDFGLQGALPTHPELLDYLATDFKQSGWDVKGLIKKMVMSSTYRQSSSCSIEDRSRDPDNVYLARGPSYRLSAEMIRDNALMASGLLNPVTGGESVKPYQPEGLWIEKGNFSKRLLRYKVTKGDSLYRRSMYTFVKRSSPHPMMTTFDAPNRDVCTIQRESTNTPLQALVLLNDPQFVEAAKVLAEKMQKEGGASLADQLTYAFRSCTGRSPQKRELDLFAELYENNKTRFLTDQDKAYELLNVGDYEFDDRLNIEHTAALTIVTNTMLNHDDSYMKR